jgi:hypothetical protein
MVAAARTKGDQDATLADTTRLRRVVARLANFLQMPGIGGL